MSKKTHMQRSLEIIKTQDVVYQKVEYWHHYAKNRIDLFGIIDVLILDDTQTIGVQVCGRDYQAHVRKIRDSTTITPWLTAGNLFEIWSWREYLKKRGGKAKVWRCKITDVLLVKGEVYFEER